MPVTRRSFVCYLTDVIVVIIWNLAKVECDNVNKTMDAELRQIRSYPRHWSYVVFWERDPSIKLQINVDTQWRISLECGTTNNAYNATFCRAGHSLTLECIMVIVHGIIRRHVSGWINAMTSVRRAITQTVRTYERQFVDIKRMRCSSGAFLTEWN